MSVATRTRSALRSSGGSPAPGLGGSGSASESPARGRRSSSALSSSSDEKDYTPTWPWHAYLTREGVANVKVYQYHGVDNSLIAKYIMQPFWKFSVNYLPIWLAPNMVTLIGFIAMLFAYALTAYYCPTVTEAAPSWVYLTCAICMFIYQTMDAMDGKQARRTETSSPLGELFDHGCDALTTNLTLISGACAMQLGAGWVFWITNTITFLGFYFAQWEEYHTQILDLGFFGVTEGQLCYIGIMIVSAVFGPQWWAQSFQVGAYQVEYRVALMAVSWLGGIFTLATNMWRVVALVRQGKVGLLNALVRVLPGIAVHLLSSAWLHLSNPDIFESDPHMFTNLLGLLTAYVVGRVILARVSKDKFVLVPKVLYPFPFVILNSFLGHPVVSDRIALYAYSAFALVMYLYFSMSVIFQLCFALKIRALTIAPEKVEKIREKMAAEQQKHKH